jgi:hypothetical protein
MPNFTSNPCVGDSEFAGIEVLTQKVMMGEKENVTIKLASRDCGDGYDADDPEVPAAFFTMVGKAVRCGAQGLVNCCEPESARANKVLPEARVKTPLNGPCAEFPEKIGAVALNGRRFIYGIDQKENPVFHARPAL